MLRRGTVYTLKCQRDPIGVSISGNDKIIEGDEFVLWLSVAFTETENGG